MVAIHDFHPFSPDILRRNINHQASVRLGNQIPTGVYVLDLLDTGDRFVRIVGAAGDLCHSPLPFKEKVVLLFKEKSYTCITTFIILLSHSRKRLLFCSRKSLVLA